MKDKTDRLLDAVEYTDEYTDEELHALLADPGVREFYKRMCKTADALSEADIPDIDSEWKCLSNEQNHPGRSVFIPIVSLVRRNVAAAVIIAVASLAVVATTIGAVYSIVRTKIEQSQTTSAEDFAVEEVGGTEPAGTVQFSNQKASSGNIVFKNTSLESILAEIAACHDVTVVYKNTETKNLNLYFNWNRQLSLEEVLGQLNNFNRIQITLSDSIITVE